MSLTSAAPRTPTATEPLPVWIDCDTGVDDAMALVLAWSRPELDVLGVTCSAGNTSAPQCVINSLKVAALCGVHDTHIAAGALKPLLGESRDAAHVHGNDGMADLNLPALGILAADAPLGTAYDGHAVNLLRDTLVARMAAGAEPLTLITLAPLTNIALLVSLYPEVLPGIGHVVMMGGSASRGNATALAEFNFWHDPEAAAIVFESGLQLSMYGLDVFEKIEIAEEIADELVQRSRPQEKIVGHLLKHRMVDETGAALPYWGLIGDAGAVASVVRPDLIAWEFWPVRIELADGLARGASVVDQRDKPGEDLVHGVHREWPVVRVAMRCNADELGQFFLNSIAGV